MFEDKMPKRKKYQLLYKFLIYVSDLQKARKELAKLHTGYPNPVLQPKIPKPTKA